jgi:hypothetical protein
MGFGCAHKSIPQKDPSIIKLNKILSQKPRDFFPYSILAPFDSPGRFHEAYGQGKGGTDQDGLLGGGEPRAEGVTPCSMG